MGLQALPETELGDVERLRLRHRADDGMKSLPFRQGMNAEGPVGEADEFVTGVGHGATAHCESEIADLKSNSDELFFPSWRNNGRMRAWIRC
jgi:hypothetical protein